MKTFLARRWFLLLLVTCVLLACLAPQWFGWAGRIDPRFVVAPALFLISFALPSRSLARAVVRPGPALWAVALSYGLVPACAWLGGALLPVEDFRIGLVIVASVPCTLASAVLWTRMGGGDEAVAMLVILVTTATSWLVTPAWLALTTGADVAIDTLAMMKDLLLTLVVPVGLGQLCRAARLMAHIAARHQRLLGVISQLLILVVLFKAAASVSLRLRSETVVPGGLIFLTLAGLCGAIHLLALSTGLWSSRLLGLDHPRQVAVAFACSQKTLPVALLILERYFADYSLAVVPVAFYHFGQLVVDTFIADRLAACGLAQHGS
jgi:sodium/bile acid cotransporter 7